MADIIADRPAAMKTLLDRFYNIDVLGGSRVSDQAWWSSFYAAIRVAPAAALGCVPACLEDFRGIWPRSTFPSCCCRATKTASCLPRPPATAFPRCSGTAVMSA